MVAGRPGAGLMGVMRELWETGRSDFKGQHFTMNDCHLLPKPTHPITVVSAGQSDRGMKFVADYCDYNFVAAFDDNNPKAVAATIERLKKATAGVERKIGALVLLTVIADETEEKAQARLNYYNAGADVEPVANGVRDAVKKPLPKDAPIPGKFRIHEQARAGAPAEAPKGE